MAIHHFAAMALFALLASTVFGVVAKDTPGGRFLYALKSFVLFVGIAVLLGWIMYPFPR